MHAPTLSISEDYHGIDNITVTVNWTQQAAIGVRYSVNLTPWVPLMHIGGTSYQLTIPYNTEYNFRVVATAPCRPNITSFITLYYGENNNCRNNTIS